MLSLPTDSQKMEHSLSCAQHVFASSLLWACAPSPTFVHQAIKKLELTGMRTYTHTSACISQILMTECITHVLL